MCSDSPPRKLIYLHIAENFITAYYIAECKQSHTISTDVHKATSFNLSYFFIKLGKCSLIGSVVLLHLLDISGQKSYYNDGIRDNLINMFQKYHRIEMTLKSM